MNDLLIRLALLCLRQVSYRSLTNQQLLTERTAAVAKLLQCR